MNNRIAGAQRWVIKIGSALLTDGGQGLNPDSLADWANQIAELRHQGKEIVLVSSGSVAEGMSRLGWKERPGPIHELQAAAAIGQMGLIQAYESCFKRHNLHSAQILLTHEDLSNRRRYLNSRSTLRTLISLGAIPVVNENDTVAIEELQFGDNDTLAALVANLIDADMLLLLTDQSGLYDSDPRSNPNAKFIHEARASDKHLLGFAGEAASTLSRGGMRTKVTAARRAARSGTHTIIASGAEKNIILRAAAGEELGTRLLADQKPVNARKQWIANQMKPKGDLQLDDGAVRALCESGKSLLPVGIKGVSGSFKRGDLVNCLAPDSSIIAVGLCNYEAEEVAALQGKPSRDIPTILGYVDEPEIIHRDNLALL